MMACFMLIYVPTVVGQPPPGISDAAITDSIRSELSGCMYPDVRDISVTTSDGIVTLRGDADSLIAKEEAARIASGMRGVRGVANDITVTPAERPDADLLADINRAIAADPSVRTYQVDALVNQGEVTLIGVVNSHQERLLAEEVVSGVRGVKNVANFISVNYSKPVSDADIAAMVSRELSADPYVDDGAVHFTVTEGVVQLHGRTWNYEEKARVIEHAWVPGVVAVNADDLDVAGWERKPENRPKKVLLTDEAIEDAVEELIHRDPRVVSVEVSAHSSNGVVTLRGAVNNVRARQAAEQQTWCVAGVREVVNRLTVWPGVEIPDDYIEAQVSDAILRHPLLNRFYINVKAIHGMVYMDGTVSSSGERSDATELASAVNGVRGVINNLEIAPPVVAAVPVPVPVPVPVAARPAPPVALKNDTAIEMEIRRRMFWSHEVDGSRILVKVMTGTAVLTGSVGSDRERRAAEQLAYVSGASWVNNMLQVQTTVAMQVPPPEVTVVPPKNQPAPPAALPSEPNGQGSKTAGGAPGTG
jgi:osmotically-inducible protein OsmY